MNFNKITKLWYILLFVPLLLVTSCGDDDEPDVPTAADVPVASYQFEIDTDNFLLVTFTNFSTNAVSYSWDFGNGESSTDENPTHTYAAEGDYVVVLTATNADGVTATKEESFTLTDPNSALKLLTGEVSKTWKPYRVGVTASLGPDASNPGGWWAGFENNGARSCLYEQTFTFHLDGTFVFDDMGTFWGENDPFGTTAVHETCFEPTAGNMGNVDGADVSAWGSGTHAFEYDASVGQVTLNGMGAWMGFTHTVGGADLYSNVPTATRTFNISIVQETGYDVMTVTYDYGADGLWTSVYASYSDASLEPDVVVGVPVFGEDLDDITPSAMSHTFASAESFVELGYIGGGSIITVGVDDPADANAAKVGKFERVAGTPYQEAIIRVSPDLKDFGFDNITTLSLDVYIPSSNDYTGSLTKIVELGIADQSATEQWWTDIYKYESGADLAEDTWVTLTYDITAPTAVGTADTTPKDRTDLDMFYINIGSGDHNDGGVFYVRNLKFE
jgi:PKD repeat protein